MTGHNFSVVSTGKYIVHGIIIYVLVEPVASAILSQL